jgi:hypothetical protein
VDPFVLTVNNDVLIWRVSKQADHMLQMYWGSLVSLCDLPPVE